MTRLKYFSDDTDSTLAGRACDSDSTKMARAHRCYSVGSPKHARCCRPRCFL